MVYTLLSGPMVYTLFPLFPQGNAILRSFFLLCDFVVERQTKRGGLPQWWCILFFPLAKICTKIITNEFLPANLFCVLWERQGVHKIFVHNFDADSALRTSKVMDFLLNLYC